MQWEWSFSTLNVVVFIHRDGSGLFFMATVVVFFSLIAVVFFTLNVATFANAMGVVFFTLNVVLFF